MHARSSLGSVRLVLLAALGSSAALACSGTVQDGTGGRQTGNDGGPGGSSVGGGGAGGGDGGAGNAGGVAGAGGSFGGAPACDNPIPLPGGNPGDPSGGYVQCADGSVHRPTVAACWEHLGPPDAGIPIRDAPDGSNSIGCRTNGECTDRAHGYCADSSFYFGPPPYWQATACAYGCVEDAECGAGQICLCGASIGACVAANCRTDSDCPTGIRCEEHYTSPGCGPNQIQFTCGPLCRTDSDCGGGSGGYTCKPDGNCQGNAVCGRPFLVEGAAVLAAPARRGDWSSEVGPDVSGLSLETRRALAEHYTAIALMEHASVAAFARFSLELLGMGAPAELVELSTTALSDETRHARVCFGLAAAYGGAEVGPGRLATESALSGGSVAERVKTAFLEACVGETLAAIEVAESALRATDPAVKALLSRIAEDETRHAALGFKFVKWALEQMDEGTRRGVEGELRAAFEGEVRRDGPEAATSGREPALVAHGMLPASERAELRAAALRDVVAPCVRVLLRGAPDRVAA